MFILIYPLRRSCCKLQISIKVISSSVFIGNNREKALACVASNNFQFRAGDTIADGKDSFSVLKRYVHWRFGIVCIISQSEPILSVYAERRNVFHRSIIPGNSVLYGIVLIKQVIRHNVFDVLVIVTVVCFVIFGILLNLSQIQFIYKEWSLAETDISQCI